MNTAPRDDLQFGDWHTTAEEIRDWERIRKANGGEQRLLLAIHDATGATAGFTEVGRHPRTDVGSYLEACGLKLPRRDPRGA